MRKLLKSIAIGSLVAISAVLPLANSTASADFASDPGTIMSDALFDNSNTMSAAQIDDFLNVFPNSCISPNSGFRAVDPNGYNPTAGYSYGGYVTAGQVIYDAAQAYTINPQVLLSTLQKEQSLVNGSGGNFCNNGSENKYTAAVGYGCPDSGITYNYTGLNLYQRNGVIVSSTGPTCVNTAVKAGFSQQLIRGAWLLKFGEQRSKGNVSWAVIKGSWDNSDDPQTCYGGPMTQGTFARCPSGGATYYDGFTTIDGTATQMKTGSTAAFYWYTPHFHGNQSFSTIFTQWFGNPTLGCAPSETTMPQTVSMYNPKTYDHFYTAYRCEANIVGYTLGYNYEGAIYNTSDPATVAGAVPVYRLYNRSTSQHLWTTSQEDIASAQQRSGFQLEGIAFYTYPSTGAGARIVWRLYNPKTFQHVWAVSQESISLMTQKLGFNVEGIGFYTQ